MRAHRRWHRCAAAEQHIPEQTDAAQAAVTALRTSHERVLLLRSELKEEITRRRFLLQDTRSKVLRASLGVSVQTGGDPLRMMAAGLAMEKPKTVRVGQAAAPGDLRAVPTDNEGEARLRWQRPVRRCTFEIQSALESAPDKWTRAELPTQSASRAAAVIGGLQSGGKYLFRVRACNAHGESPWSNLAAVRVK